MDAPSTSWLTGDVPGATQEELFGHDARPRPQTTDNTTARQRKSKSRRNCDHRGSSARPNSGSYGAGASPESKPAEKAFEAQAEKDRTLMRLEELRFLATSTKDLDEDDAYWIKKQKKLIKNKMKNDLGDEDEDE
ncbi:hypothetical protein Tco_0519932 [Tanacetum coccineum]